MKMIPTRINSRQHLMSNRMRMLLLKVVKMFPIRKHQQLPNNQIFLFRQRILPLKQYHRLKLLSRIIRMPHQLLMLRMKMKLKTLPMRMPKQPHRKLELLPDPTSYRATGNPSLTDGILMDDIFKAIDQLAETGECDPGTIIYHCESMRYAG